MEVSWDGSKNWQPSHSLPRADIPVEGDEGYTPVGENLPPLRCKQDGPFIERKSRYWIEARAGLKDTKLFAKATAWRWAKMNHYIRWFTDGERRYAQQVWQMTSVYLKSTEVSGAYGHRKVWRHGLEVAINIKGSQGNRCILLSATRVTFTPITMKQTTVP
ncbi:MAG: hypothetical protein KGQ16_12160 [Cyanobacteria bacterium REEB444]|nr:hypothetical protein [Cyanobacteria bacterium REEB444]